MVLDPREYALEVGVVLLLESSSVLTELRTQTVESCFFLSWGQSVVFDICAHIDVDLLERIFTQVTGSLYQIMMLLLSKAVVPLLLQIFLICFVCGSVQDIFIVTPSVIVLQVSISKLRVLEGFNNITPV